MLRSSLIAVGAALVCSVASAQNKMDSSKLFPIQGKMHDAGIYDMRTGKWFPRSQAGQLGAAQQTIYNNTCFWSNGNPFFYFGIHSPCEDWYDDGRVPASGPSGAGPDNATNTYTFGYCTGAPSGIVDVDWALFDTGDNANAANCAGGVGPGAPAALVGFISAAAGFPLPGSTNPTVNATCWAVTFTTGTASVCMQSGATTADLFTMGSAFNNTIAQSSGTNYTFALQGNPLCGDPTNNPGGTGTYNIPPGTDAVTGGPCGTGLDNQDFFWLNVDGVPGGGTPPPACTAQGASGTGCYFFGGYPAAPYSGMYFVVEADGGCGCTGSVTTYCTSKTASNGCVPDINSVGVPDANAGSGFVVTTDHVVNNKNGVHFYSTAGLQGVPFQGGFLCMKQPIKRLPVQNSGSTGPACGTSTTGGFFQNDFNVKIASGTDPALIAGALVGIQAWYRDPASPSTTGLSNALNFVICP